MIWSWLLILSQVEPDEPKSGFFGVLLVGAFFLFIYAVLFGGKKK